MSLGRAMGVQWCFPPTAGSFTRRRMFTTRPAIVDLSVMFGGDHEAHWPTVFCGGLSPLRRKRVQRVMETDSLIEVYRRVSPLPPSPPQPPSTLCWCSRNPACSCMRCLLCHVHRSVRASSDNYAVDVRVTGSVGGVGMLLRGPLARPPFVESCQCRGRVTHTHTTMMCRCYV